MNYNHDDYLRLFQVQSGTVPFFAADIWGQYYKKLESLQTYKNGVWTSYIPNYVKDKTLQAGVELYSNPSLFNEYKEDFKRYQSESKELFEEILKSDEITEQMAKSFFKEATRLFVYYSKVDFFYTDLAYLVSKETKSPDLERHLSQLDKIKNPGREYLNAVFFGDSSFLFKIIKKIANEHGVTFEKMLGYSVQEILDFFSGYRLEDKEIDSRLDAFVMIGKGDEVEYFSGKDAKKFINDFERRTENKNNRVLKGTAACPGCVKGRIKVIPSNYYYDFSVLPKIVDEMNEGDILVAETTSPELMPAIRKASAIITNQGGQLSHAAIVSREMKVPCLVAVDRATERLKDGDMVEVDADCGVVTKIN